MKDVLVISFQSLTTGFAEGMAKVGYELSRSLHKRNRLYNFVVSSKGPHCTPFPSRNVNALSRPISLLFRMVERLNIFEPYRLRHFKEVMFDVACKRLLDKKAKTLISTNPFMPRTFRRAKNLGIKVILIPGNPEESRIKDIVENECHRLSFHLNDAYTDIDRHRSYQEAMRSVDMIVGFTAIITSTFKEKFTQIEVFGFPCALSRKEALNNLYSYTDSLDMRSGELKVGFLAYSVLLKGLHRLIAAWSQLDTSDAQLIIAGPIDTSIQPLIESNLKNTDCKSVKFIGKIDNLNKFFRDIDLLVVPSLIDGGPLTIIEALQRGVPVLTTKNCGYSQFISDGVNGLVVGVESEDLVDGLRLVLQKKYKFSQNTLSDTIMGIDEFSEKLIDKIIM
jgi:glycosyltransferase involved in cell wall biosynthesis